MSDKQTLAEAIASRRKEANGFHEISQSTPGGDRLAERLGDIADTEASVLELVASGEIPTPEMEALAKIPPMIHDETDSGGFKTVTCRVCGNFAEGNWHIDHEYIDHADDCIWLRACRITGENQ